ncbi:MAG: hypothetical protein HYS23_01365 [Geobacter sp.]|nr:hypothetical protein [Geobacter sp.]
MEDIERSAQPTETPFPGAQVSLEPGRNLKSRLSGIALCLLVSLTTSVVTLFVYDRWYVQKIVAVDMKGYITLQRYKYKDGKVNDEDLRKAFDKLEQLINTIPKNRVVIMGDTAIRNAEVFKLGHEEELKQYEELLRRALQGNPVAQDQ